MGAGSGRRWRRAGAGETAIIPDRRRIRKAGNLLPLLPGREFAEEGIDGRFLPLA